MDEQQRGVKLNSVLTFTSLLTLLLLTFHLADDIVRGFEKGGLSNLIAVPIVVLWLYGTLVLTGRRSGFIINLLLSLFGLIVPLIHMQGKGVGAASRIAGTSGAFFFVWTLIAIAVTALFSVILSVRGLWRLRRAAGASPSS
jgi:hypothetical protein